MKNTLPDPLMIMCAPNGARKMPADHPELPITARQLARCASQLLDAGASVLHLHVRDARGRHSLSPTLYREAIAAVRQAVGDKLVIQVTTEAVGIYNREQQIDVVQQLRPEAVSLALRELCPDENSIADSADFFQWCATEKIWTQFILYSPEEVARFAALHVRGVFAQDEPSVLFVLGRYSQDLTGRPEELQDFINAWPGEAGQWACCCFGVTEQQAMLAAVRAGGHVRLGFENNLHRADGTIAHDNAELLRDFVEQLPLADRRLADADDIRSLYLP